MVIYWLMFLLPALASTSPYRLDRTSRVLAMALIGIIVWMLVGLRDHVGHDWNNYLNIFYRSESNDFVDSVLETEPGYSLFNWLSSQLGWGIWGVNAFCSVITTWGLFAFCARQPNFWRTLALAVPVLIIGVTMGATRQGVAVGFLMLAYNAFQDKKLFRYLALVVLAVLFHRTAAIFLLPAWFIHGRLRMWPLIIGGAAFFLIGIFFLKEAVPYYQNSYVENDIVSSGALPRTALNVAAAATFLTFRKTWSEKFEDGNFYTLMAGIILLMSGAVFFAPTAADRMSMYLLPIQVAIFARLPDVVSPRLRTQAAIAVIVAYGAVLFTWLNFSFFAQASWIPYGNVIWS